MTYTQGTIFKVLNGTKSMHGGDADWTPGEWMPEIEDIEPCVRGYHLCAGPRHLLEWIGPDIWTAGYDGGRYVHHGDKIVVSTARIIKHVDTWNERTARLFAADCAEHVLHLFEDVYPGDDRPRRAIEAARRYAKGEITGSDMEAARDAAWAAAWAAAGDAVLAAWAAAGAAARAAVGAATGAATGAAVWDASEKKWQAERLLHYLNGGE